MRDATTMQPDAWGAVGQTTRPAVRMPWHEGNRAFLCVAVAALAQALAGPVASSLRNEGLAVAAQGLFGVSAATWLAAGIGLANLRLGRSLASPVAGAAYPALLLEGREPGSNGLRAAVT